MVPGEVSQSNLPTNSPWGSLWRPFTFRSRPEVLHRTNRKSGQLNDCFRILEKKVEALDAYRLLIGDKHPPGGDAAGRTGKTSTLPTTFGGNDWVQTGDLALMKYYG